MVCQYGETGLTAELEPATIDGLVYASGMVILYAARHRLPVPKLARWMLALGIAASLAVNVAQGWSHGLAGAVVAAWPAVSLTGSYEMLAWIIRTAAASGPGHGPAADHGVPQADQPRTTRRPAVPPVREAVPAAASGDGASPEYGSAHDRFPVAGAAAPVHGPGLGGPGCTGQADREDQASGPVQESTGPRGPSSPAGPGQRLPLRHRPVTSMPLRLPPTAPASGMAGRCPSASWQRHSAGPHGGGRATGWPKPCRERPRVDRAGKAALTFERCVRRFLATGTCRQKPAASVRYRHAPSAGCLHRARVGAGMLAVPAPAEHG